MKTKLTILFLSLLTLIISCGKKDSPTEPTPIGGLTVVEVNSSQFDMGNVVIGTGAKESTFTVKNTGNSDLTLGAATPVSLNGTDAAFFTITQQPAKSILTPNETTAFKISFTPIEGRQYSIGVSIVHDGQNKNTTATYSFTLKGTGFGPEIKLLQNTTEFLTNSTYSFTAIQTDIEFTLKNTGTADLNVTDIQLDNTTDFSLTAASKTIAPGQTATFKVNFLAPSSGTKNGKITITNNDSDEASFILNLLGSTEAVIDVYQNSSTIANNGNYNYGTPAGAINFKIRNNGIGALKLESITLEDDTTNFSLSAGSYPKNLSAGEEETVQVSFNPQSTGVKNAKIRIISDDADRSPYIINLTGTGQLNIDVKQGTTSLSNNGTYAFGTSISPVSLTLKNSGNMPLLVSSVALDDWTSFSITASGFPKNIAPGSEETFQVFFNPQSAGAKNAKITILNTDPVKSSFIVNLTGTGVKDMTVKQGTTINNNATYDFGNILTTQISLMTFTIENSGNIPVNLSGPIQLLGGNTSDYTLGQPAASIIPGGGSTTFTVAFNPSSPGLKTAYIEIANDVSGKNPYTINLKGKGKQKWTVLVYMNGDNNLETNAIDDINEMEDVDLSGAQINLFVLFDRASGYDASNGDWTDTRLFKINYDPSGQSDRIIRSERIASTELALNTSDSTELNMGDYNNLSKFVDFGQNNYPAEKYFVIIWNHGTGWRSLNTLAKGSFQRMEGKALNTQSVYSKASSRTTSDYRAISVDETSSNAKIYTQQLRLALSGKGVNVIGFDACLMQMIEVAYELRNTVKYMIGSEELEPGPGWNYKLWLSSFKNSTKTETDLAQSVVNAYGTTYNGQIGTTLAAVDLSQINNVMSKLNTFSLALYNAIGSGTTSTDKQNRAAEIAITIFNYAEDFFTLNGDLNIDIWDMANQIKTRTAYASTEAENLKTAINQAVVAEWHNSTSGLDGNPRAHGLALHFCMLDANGNFNGLSTAYGKANTLYPLQFVQDSDWAVNDSVSPVRGLLFRLFYESF